MNDSAAIGTILSFLRLYEDGNSPALQFIGRWGGKIYDTTLGHQISVHLLLSALFPLYIAAHASLKQPSSAAKPSKDENQDEDDEIEVRVAQVEGLTPSDALLFPVTASIMLSGLYFFIKWMGNADLLNKILTYYFSGTGLIAMTNLVSNALDVMVTFVFPDHWSDGKNDYIIDAESRQQLTGTHVNYEVVTKKRNPFPGFMSKIWFPARVNQFLWSVRSALKKHWILRVALYGIVNHKQSIHLNNILGLIAGCAATFIYTTVSKYWWIQNLMGFGFIYGSMEIMSPTTFTTGSLVLCSLFVYDIVMVFYTPMMMTVATSLDVPMKLVFPGPKNTSSILGLGDIVVPGIMLSLALRFDLYLHYFYKQVPIKQDENTSQLSVESSSDESFSSSESLSSEPSQQSSRANETLAKPNGATPSPTKTPASTVTKAKYLDPTGLWGERFWTRKSPITNTSVEGAQFPKPYFAAGMIGYIIGMCITLYVCNVWKHGQPALLYLVPGVLGALWGTAVVRGELNLMYQYTEDGVWEWDEQALGKKQKKKDGDGHAIKSEEKDAKTIKGGKDEVKKTSKETAHAQHIFLLTVTEPKHGTSKQKSN